ncbi:MAG: hypothetical protein E5X67_36150 [Mesorhizobium sp.]|nr:MAG: hypothetical protein E5X67_36150 [Mesorhizobium sp.]
MGGDWQLHLIAPFFNLGDWRKPRRHTISPPVGEMAGRPEGGAVPPTPEALLTNFLYLDRQVLWQRP